MGIINEELARTAWNGIHMDSYSEGSATREWEAMCAKAKEAADRAIKRAPDRTEEIEKLYDRYERKAADYINERNGIDAMCPSVFITGAGNFPVRKKQRQIDRMDSFYKKDWGFDRIIDRLNLIGTEREPIRASDENAVDRLRAKLEKQRALHERMVKTNRLIRLKDVEKGNGFLREMGYTDNQIATLREGDFLGRVGFPDYELRSSNDKIKRLEKRIKELETAKESETEDREVTICGEPCTVVENTDNMRLQLFFDGKPSAECRSAVKGASFRWAPSQGAWQRQLTNNARYALNSIVDKE